MVHNALLLGHSWQTWFDFADTVESPQFLQKEEQQQILSKLHEVLKPFLLRRLKADVQLALPSKRVVVLALPLSLLVRVPSHCHVTPAPQQQQYYRDLELGHLQRTVATACMHAPVTRRELWLSLTDLHQGAPDADTCAVRSRRRTSAGSSGGIVECLVNHACSGVY